MQIVFSKEWDGLPGYPSVDTADFEDLGDGRTRIVATTQFITAEERDGMVASGMEDGMNDGFRTGKEHLADVAAVVADLRARLPGAKVFLVGLGQPFPVDVRRTPGMPM